MNTLTLHDELTALYLPQERREKHRLLPAFKGDDEWHHISWLLDLNVWEDIEEGEAIAKAALYLVHDGSTLTCDIPIEVEDKRTKKECVGELGHYPPKLKPIRRVVIEHKVKQIGKSANKFPSRVIPAEAFGNDFDKYEGLTLRHEEGQRDGVWVSYSQTFLYTRKSDEQLLKEFN
jgi:hypothetical protein